VVYCRCCLLVCYVDCVVLHDYITVNSCGRCGLDYDKRCGFVVMATFVVGGVVIVFLCLNAVWWLLLTVL